MRARRSHCRDTAVDLGGPSSVSRVDLYARSDGGNTGNGFPGDFTIETSLDGTTWTPVATANDLPQPAPEYRRSTARYVQVRGTGLRPDGEGDYRMQLSSWKSGDSPTVDVQDLVDGLA